MKYLVFLLALLGCYHGAPIGKAEPPLQLDDLLARTVIVERNCPNGWATGSGVILYSSELFGMKVATAEHVVSEFSNFLSECKVGIRTHSGDYFPASYAFSDPKRDIAVVTTFDGFYMPGVPLSHGTLGQKVTAVGYPWDKIKRKPQLSVSQGLIVTAYEEWEYDDAAYRISASIMPGSSGGGLWSSNGELLGLTVAAWVKDGIPYWDHAYVTAIEGALPLLKGDYPVEDPALELE